MSCIIYHVLVRFAVHKYSLKTQLQFQVIFMFLSFVQVVYNYTLKYFKRDPFFSNLKSLLYNSNNLHEYTDILLLFIQN